MFYVYRHYDDEGDLLYIGQTYNWQGRTNQHKTHAVWWNAVTTIKLERFETMTLAVEAEKKAIVLENPKFNVTHSKRNKRPKNVARGKVLKAAEKAKKRRAKLLIEFEKIGCSQKEFADKHGVTRARMGQLIAMAKKDTSLPV